jgi:hypothetical protein
LKNIAAVALLAAGIMQACAGSQQHETCSRSSLLEDKVRKLEARSKEAEETGESVMYALITFDRLWGELRNAEVEFFTSMLAGVNTYFEGTDQQYLAAVDASAAKLENFGFAVQRIQKELSKFPKVGCESLKQIVAYHEKMVPQHRQTLADARKTLPSQRRDRSPMVVPKPVVVPEQDKEKSYVGGPTVKKPNWRALKSDLSPQEVIALVGSPDQERYMTKEMRASGAVKTLSGEPMKNSYVWKFRLPERPSEEVIAIFSNDKLVSWGRRPASNSLDDITIETGKDR